MNEAQKTGTPSSASRSASTPRTSSTSANKSSVGKVNAFRDTGGEDQDASAPKLSPSVDQNQYIQPQRPEILLLCVREDRYTTKLVPNDINCRYTDADVYRSIRAHYEALKRLSWLRLNVISHIEWKQVQQQHVPHPQNSTANIIVYLTVPHLPQRQSSNRCPPRRRLAPM